MAMKGRTEVFLRLQKNGRSALLSLGAIFFQCPGQLTVLLPGSVPLSTAS
jgi:hypothetical protein